MLFRCFLRSLPSNGSTLYIAPPPTGVPPFLVFPRDVLVTSVIGLTFLPRGSVPQRLLSNCSRCPFLKPLVPSGSLIRGHLVQVYPHHPAFPICGGKSSESGQITYFSSSYSMCSLFFRFGEGDPSTMFLVSYSTV
jgi:hypothetical protein